MLLQIRMAKVEYNGTHVERKGRRQHENIYFQCLLLNQMRKDGLRFMRRSNTSVRPRRKTQEGKARRHIHEVLSMIVEEFIEEGP